jgi:hypothetical protein
MQVTSIANNGQLVEILLRSLFGSEAKANTWFWVDMIRNPEARCVSLNLQ